MAQRVRLPAALALVLITGALAVVSASQGASPATVNVAQSKLGRILVDAKGRTLYLYGSETARNILCTATLLDCTRLWPPLLASGKPTAGPGVEARLLGTAKRTKPAGTQVTYNGHPLYRCACDKKPGDTAGQGFGATSGGWYVVSPKGTPIRKK